MPHLCPFSQEIEAIAMEGARASHTTYVHLMNVPLEQNSTNQALAGDKNARRMNAMLAFGKTTSDQVELMSTNERISEPAVTAYMV